MKKLAAAALGVLLSAGAGSQALASPAAPLPGAGVQALSEVAHDQSPPLRDVAPIPPRPDEQRGRERRRHLQPRHGRGRGQAGRGLLPDPVVQQTPGTFSMPSSAVSFDGVDNVDGVLPPDPNGAVGPNHYVQWVNTSFAIYDKSGTLLYGPAEGNTLWSGFGGPCEEDNEGDPIVLHDHLADRWLMSQLALPNFPFGPFYQCIAVSETADPTGAYHRYAFAVSDSKLNDYPKFGVWPDAYYLAVNQFDALTDEFLGQGVLAFERDEMLGGRAARLVYMDLESVDPNLGGMLPADMDGPPPPPDSPAYFVQFDDDASGAAVQDQLQLWRFHVDWSDPQASTFSGPVILPTAAFDSDLCGYARNCIPQAGTRRRVDAISDRLMYRLQYRNFGTHESLVVNHTVDVGGDHAGIRWYEIRDPGGAPFIRQQGTYAPDGAHRWMGSAAMDGAGDLAIGFSVSSSTLFPSIRYAGRLSDDPLGTLPQGEATLMTGTGSQTDQSGRWGDYSALSVDPTDHCTFWYTHEYYAATSAIDWRTRIGSFRFPSCTSELPFVTVEPTVASTPEFGTAPAVVTVRRTGSTGAALVVQYTVRGTATPASDYVPLPGTVTIPAGSATTTVDVVPIDDSVVENEETVVVTLSADPAYQAGTPSSAIVTIISDERPPDLVVSAFTAPATGGAGEPITVNDTTANQGGAADPSTTRFYLSTDETLDAADVLLGGRSVPALATGATSAGSTSVTIPAATTGGIHWIIARADGADALAESDEDNNTSARSIVIGGDLTITAFTVPQVAGAGATLTVSDTTLNQGGGTAGPSTTAFFLSTNSTFDAGDALLGSRALPALAPGTSSSATTALTIPAATAAGTWFVIARVDAGNAVAETVETNNTSVRQVVIGPDLLVATLTAPATAPSGAPIAVSDTTRNQGGGAAAASTTRFYLSTNTLLDTADAPIGSRSVGALAAGAASTATTTVTLPAGLAAGTYWILAQADADGVVGETLETNNTGVASVQIGADLAIAALTVPGTAGAGSALGVSDTTVNQGSGPAAASTTAFYLSANSIFDGGDVLLGSRPVPALAAGASSPATTALTIPAATAAGIWFVIARVDADNVVAETVETNNTSVRQVLIGPDLVVGSFVVPPTAASGSTIAVSDTTRNLGAGGAAASTTRFYLSTNAALDTADVALGARAVPALAAGAASTATTSVTIPAGLAAGTYWLLAQADADGLVGETVETNNTTPSPVQVGPDLQVSALTVPAAAGAGSVIGVSDTTANPGSGAAPASTTAFYLSTDATYDAADVPLGSRAVPALAPGASSSASTALTIPAATATGIYFVLARADADGAVSETNETNNTSARQVVIGTDLVVSSFSVPATGGAGGALTVSDTTLNQGGGTAGASTTAFYLSTNSTFDAADVLVGSRAVPSLAPGASSPAATVLTVPAATATGTYFVIARADADNVIAETAETNNTSARQVVIGPDLVIAPLTVPATAAAGASITVTDTTRNQGGGAAAASTTRFLLSTNAALDAGDVPLGSRAVGALAPGTASTAATTLTLPAGLGVGTYWILAQADADGVVGETLETNNIGAASVQIGADLAIAALTVPGTAGAGSALGVTDTTVNQGSGPAAASTTAFYLSTNSTLDAADVLLGSRAVPALGAGGASTAGTVLTVPAATSAGTYFVIARADADGAVAETLETNNTSVRQVVVGPDLLIATFAVPATAAAGSAVTVSDTTRNQGAGEAGASVTRFYLSTNAVLDASDVVLGERAVPLLTPGANSTASTTLTVPAGTAPGSYFVIFRADAAGAVAETQETNNTAPAPMQVTAGG